MTQLSSAITPMDTTLSNLTVPEPFISPLASLILQDFGKEAEVKLGWDFDEETGAWWSGGIAGVFTAGEELVIELSTGDEISFIPYGAIIAMQVSKEGGNLNHRPPPVIPIEERLKNHVGVDTEVTISTNSDVPNYKGKFGGLVGAGKDLTLILEGEQKQYIPWDSIDGIDLYLKGFPQEE